MDLRNVEEKAENWLYVIGRRMSYSQKEMISSYKEGYQEAKSKDKAEIERLKKELKEAYDAITGMATALKNYAYDSRWNHAKENPIYFLEGSEEFGFERARIEIEKHKETINKAREVEDE